MGLISTLLHALQGTGTESSLVISCKLNGIAVLHGMGKFLIPWLTQADLVSYNDILKSFVVIELTIFKNFF